MGRADVEKAVSQPPDALLQLQRKEAAASAAALGKTANGELKRPNDSSSDDSEPEPAKKAKQDDSQLPALSSALDKKPPATKIDAGKEAAIEAEVRAARERAVVPLEQRMRAFRAMLEDNNVSAFNTWEKELHKIVFDPRYLLLTSKERKQVFDKYVRERAEEERKEKKNRLQQKKAAFRALMDEAKLHSKSSYTEFSSKHGRDDRFKAIEKPRDRETYFNEFIAEVRKREKEEKEKKREQAKVDFISLLKEKAVDRHARWAEAKKKVDSEPRYKAVESSAMREDYFREYCRMVKEERKKEKDAKEKERDRSSKKEKKDKEREKEKERDKEPKEKKKKDKSGEKHEEEDQPKQPTPPPDQWAEILGIPGEERAKRNREKRLKQQAETVESKSETEKSESISEQTENSSEKSDTPEKEVVSPKQLRSSKKDLQSPIKSPPKKRKEDFKSPEPEKKSRKSEKVEKIEKVEVKRKRKKSEKE
ncbi:transcription elongation regulator 1 isoform X2 [Hyposmocoma kahamanoa]|uniref:transcription elongation regulator 1 isoform X2 n=1 Tax=Hyposmocoma kahamanoa TaxID=1477025 RepID=UPI000E6D9B3F|nr:transcription elongation regulator 1 isoform X2 [Hyposmocoma kahamanoa]